LEKKKKKKKKNSNRKEATLSAASIVRGVHELRQDREGQGRREGIDAAYLAHPLFHQSLGT
jgi:hypothetical protein